ncbi:hypothetical protein BJY24_004459 [Nocardia transvalensis]|uniref:DUF1048 domain-containing protein n=1 Tax=Nocardia transvalensis TaxID=37333 RepID=A0A7W9PG74_9NOCA|nr:DUF1048 domain-containing protein [Nocardia transvalensis]MBB5915547.1 hypothetical protein [Nocardia transvalensis]
MGVAADKGAMELIGTDIAAFCDDLVKDSPTYADIYQESVNKRKLASEGIAPPAPNRRTRPASDHRTGQTPTLPT